MTTPTTKTPAQLLLALASDSHHPPPADVLVDATVSDPLAEIAAIDARHNRGKALTQSQLAEQVFGRSRTFKDQRAVLPYLRYHLRAAVQELTAFGAELRSFNNGIASFVALTQHRYPTDPKGKPPKRRYGFRQEFISANPQFFKTNGFAIKELRHIYDWCSEIVHQAFQPYAWQTSMALRRAGDS